MSQIEEFKSILEQCQLSDLGFTGPRFTRTNKRMDTQFTQERLDRAVANSDCCGIVLSFYLEVLAARNSNHAPICLSLRKEMGVWHRRKKGFKYEACWKKSRSCKEVIKKVWRVKHRRDDPWGELKRKIHKIQAELSKWAKENAGNSEILIKQKTKLLVELQSIEGQPDMENISGIQREINELMEEDELKWKQWAKVEWLLHGDTNSKYFHACVNQRQSKNRISHIFNAEGIACTTPHAIEESFTKYFQQLFTFENPPGIEECLSATPRRVTRKMNM